MKILGKHFQEGETTMNIGFLGTSWAVSTGDRDNTSILIESDNTSVLVDCPGNAWGKLLKMGRDPLGLDAIFITHGHVDHVYGLPSLLEMMRLSGRKQTLPIYVGEDFFELTVKLLDLFEIRNHPGSFNIEPIRVSYETSHFVIKDLTVETFLVIHTVRNLALKFCDGRKSVVYSSDTAFHASLAEFARNSEALMHEATMSAKLGDVRREGHSTPSEAAKIAETARVKQLFLVHVGFSVDKHPEKAVEEARKIFKGNVVVPRDLEIYSIR
ncbi:MAG: MBL fold metallo-hydrolase [Thermotogae bacterium]|nr:MBL fold metallo-hydrolase [Thermotogota bacterium]